VSVCHGDLRRSGPCSATSIQPCRHRSVVSLVLNGLPEWPAVMAADATGISLFRLLPATRAGRTGPTAHGRGSGPVPAAAATASSQDCWDAGTQGRARGLAEPAGKLLHRHDPDRARKGPRSRRDTLSFRSSRHRPQPIRARSLSRRLVTPRFAPPPWRRRAEGPAAGGPTPPSCCPRQRCRNHRAAAPASPAHPARRPRSPARAAVTRCVGPACICLFVLYFLLLTKRRTYILFGIKGHAQAGVRPCIGAAGRTEPAGQQARHPVAEPARPGGEDTDGLQRQRHRR